MRRYLACCIAIIFPLTLPRPAAAAEADDPRPRTALSACAAGDVPRGIALLAELYAETRDPSYVFNQARCYQQNGQLESARFRFAEYLRIGQNEPPADIERATGFIKEIDETLARKRQAEIVVVPAPQSPSNEGRARSLRITGVALSVLGVVAVATGAYMSLKVQSTESDVEKRFAMMGVVTDPGALQRELSNGGRYETWQWISYGIGVAALAGAGAMFALGGWPGAGSRGADTAAVTVAPAVSAAGGGATVRMRF